MPAKLLILNLALIGMNASLAIVNFYSGNIKTGAFNIIVASFIAGGTFVEAIQ